MPENLSCLIYFHFSVLWIYFLTGFSWEHFLHNSLADDFSELVLPSRKPYVRQNIFICKSLHITPIIFLIYLLIFGMTVSKSMNIFMALTFVLIFILPRLWECQIEVLGSNLLQNGLHNFSLYLRSMENFFLFTSFFISHFHGIPRKNR